MPPLRSPSDTMNGIDVDVPVCTEPAIAFRREVSPGSICQTTNLVPTVLLVISGQESGVTPFTVYCQLLDLPLSVFGMLDWPRNNDISDEHTWNTLHQQLSAGFIRGGVWWPPSDTFESSSSEAPCRDLNGPGRYGRKDLGKHLVEKTKQQTLLAVRTASGLWTHINREIPFVLVVHPRRDGHCHITDLDEFRQVLDHSRVTPKSISVAMQEHGDGVPMLLFVFLVKWPSHLTVVFPFEFTENCG